MHQNDTGGSWAGRNAAARDAQTGISDRLSDSGPAGGDDVLARLPDLEADQANPDADPKPARSGGRILGQKLSTKLLVGGGVLLLLAAVVPWLLSPGQPEGGRSPAEWADEAPEYNAGQTAATEQNQPGTSYTPDMSFDHAIPEGPEFLNPSPGTGTNGSTKTPPWDDQQTIDAADARDNAKRWNYQAKQPGRGYPSPPATVRSPRGTPSTPASQWPATPRAPQDNAPREARRPDWSRHGSYRHPMAEPTAPQVETNRSMAIGSMRPAEPGVARLKGIIERPPVRTTHERTGPSIH